VRSVYPGILGGYKNLANDSKSGYLGLLLMFLHEKEGF